MGVPSFYRWLVHKYPKIVTDAIEEEGEEIERTLPNPNGFEFDNFYLDMNGIIHPCFHPDDDVSPPTTFEDVFGRIIEYINGLFNVVRPRKLLYMAIDGVAPRAKMNQQRARRFRTSKDTQMAKRSNVELSESLGTITSTAGLYLNENAASSSGAYKKEEMEEKLRKEFDRQGKAVLPKQESQVSDSNVITPGTEFMHMLSEKLQNYITGKMKEDLAWTKIKVILSDDNVPGEGEHKIMSFIRAQRSFPGYDPNTRHCLYGLDADLIMLALATHEVHFSILREEVLSLKTELSAETSLRYGTPKTEGDKSIRPVNKKQAYQFLNVWVLREYLALDLRITSPPEKFDYDLERIIDDFIFICFFAGNDFLPHMPSLEIHEGCIDLLMHVYKKEFRNLGGYLVDMQKVEEKKGRYIKLKRVEKFILAVGTYEEKIFIKRSQIRDKKMRRILAEYRDVKHYLMKKNDEQDDVEDGRVSDIVCSYAVAAADVGKMSAPGDDSDTVENNTKELKQKLKEYIRSQSDLFKDGSLGADKVKYGTPGWRERYYATKFSAQSTDEKEETRKNVVAKYGEGLCWVLLYYFSGVPSWTWFYPFHYGPFASDLKGLAQTNTRFQKGLPFKPFDQLMGVLPPRSAHALPTVYKGLMTNDNSNIIDFYPTEFQTDVDGKRFMWQGICKLPFIEEERLLKETKKLENELEDHERLRNSQSLDRLFARCSGQGGPLVGASKKIKDAIMMDSTIGVKGTIHVMPEDLAEAVDDTKSDRSINDSCVFFETSQELANVPWLLAGVTIPDKTVEEEDIMETVLWHECHGRSNTGNDNRFCQNRRPMTKPNQKWDYCLQTPAPAFIHRGSGHGSHNIGRGKHYDVSKPVVELRPVQEIYDGVGGLQISNTCARAGFNKPVRADSGVGWTQNFVETSSRMHCPDRPFSASRGCYKERGWFPAQRAMIQDTKHNSSPQDAPEFLTRGSGRGLDSGGGRPSPVSKPVHEHTHGSFCGELVTRDHHPSVAKTEYDGRAVVGSSRRDVYQTPHPLLNYKHVLVTGNGGTRDINGDWRSSKASGADTEGAWKNNFMGGSSQMGSPNRPVSAHRGRGRGRGR